MTHLSERHLQKSKLLTNPIYSPVFCFCFKYVNVFNVANTKLFRMDQGLGGVYFPQSVLRRILGKMSQDTILDLMQTAVNRC